MSRKAPDGNSTEDLSFLSGEVKDSERTHEFVQDLINRAVTRMNGETLPLQFALFESDKVPTNQRNLTDVRTRMGVLLEYELGQAISALLPSSVKEAATITYVIANRFPDLAFRKRNGQIGVRLEVKAIQAVAEEKSANFDTLIKDIRKGTDFVVVLLWEWQMGKDGSTRYPLIDSAYVLDAYDLALIRDCYWLNNPPHSPGEARQGFDLCFGVNCRAGNYNKEEGNYGKLMRIFDSDFETYLPGAVVSTKTIQIYYECCSNTIRLGCEAISNLIGNSFVEKPGEAIEDLSDGLPIIKKATFQENSLLIFADESMPRRGQVLASMKQHNSSYALTLNSKFDWRLRDPGWTELGRGRKPQEAVDFIRDWKHP